MNDFVIVMFSTINVSNLKIFIKSFKIIKAEGKCTNVIVILIFYRNGDKLIVDKVFSCLSSGRNHTKLAIRIDIINNVSRNQGPATNLALGNVQLLESISKA